MLEPHVRPFDVSGGPMRAWVLVGPEGVEDYARVHDWISQATEFVGTLPPKE